MTLGGLLSLALTFSFVIWWNWIWISPGLFRVLSTSKGLWWLGKPHHQSFQHGISEPPCSWFLARMHVSVWGSLVCEEGQMEKETWNPHSFSSDLVSFEFKCFRIWNSEWAEESCKNRALKLDEQCTTPFYGGSLLEQNSSLLKARKEKLRIIRGIVKQKEIERGSVYIHLGFWQTYLLFFFFFFALSYSLSFLHLFF